MEYLFFTYWVGFGVSLWRALEGDSVCWLLVSVFFFLLYCFES